MSQEDHPQNDELMEEQETHTSEEPAGGEVEESVEEAVETPEGEDESPEDQLEQVQAEAAEYLDGWQRARAEFANYKKRMEREMEDARTRISGDVFTRDLGIIDDLERALAKAPEDSSCGEWISGIELIHQKLIAMLEAEGVEPIEAQGERFDPMLHEAISYEESEEHEGGSVIEVTQRGYKLGERILRPAMVRVAR